MAKISLGDIQAVLGGVNPIRISEYYSNAAPGSIVRLSNFRNIILSAPQQTIFTGTYATLMSAEPLINNQTAYEWITGCSGTNLTRNGLSTFNNINSQEKNRVSLLYYPQLILQAKAGDTIQFNINIYAISNYIETITGYVNFGDEYKKIGSVRTPTPMFDVEYTYTLEITYTIPVGTPVGNYALGATNHYDQDVRYMSGNAYSLQIIP